MLDFAGARRNMVDCQLRTFDITDRAVLAAMGEVARERFVPTDAEDLAYTDRETPLGSGRAMMAPMVLGRLLQALRVEPGQRVMEVACGLGYGAAILRQLGAAVTALESRPDLAEAARERLAPHAVEIQEGPLADGSSGSGRFDRILINGAVEVRPDRLLDQLAEGGRLACVMGGKKQAGKAVLFVRSAGGIGTTPLFDAHAPLLAEFEEAAAFVF